jgi:hypothetical protein
MSASALLVELEAVGIRLHRDGDDLLASIRPGANFDPFRQRVREHKPALLASLALQEQIVAAATAATAAFDRAEYDHLWTEWHALQEEAQ